MGTFVEWINDNQLAPNAVKELGDIHSKLIDIFSNINKSNVISNPNMKSSFERELRSACDSIGRARAIIYSTDQ